MKLRVDIHREATGIRLLATDVSKLWCKRHAEASFTEMELLKQLTEFHASIGSYTVLDHACANPPSGTGSALCIAESLATAMSGRQYAIGSVFCIPGGKQGDVVRALAEEGEVFLQLVPPSGKTSLYFVKASSEENEDLSLLVCESTMESAIDKWRGHYQLDSKRLPDAVGLVPGVEGVAARAIDWCEVLT